MTAQKASEYMLDAGLFAVPPRVGQYLRCPGRAGTAVLLSTVRSVGGDTKPLLRLIGLRLRAPQIPADAVMVEWPKAHRAPSRAAEPPAPSDRPAIVTQRQKQQAERKRITQHRRAGLEAENQVIEPVRRANGTAIAGTWRDPDDLGKAAVLRRQPKEVKGFRGDDPIQRLQDNDTITRAMAKAARRLRRDWEIGAQLQHGSVDWERTGSSSGGTPTGFAEHVLQYLERYQQAKSTLGRLFEIVECVCLNGQTIVDYATRNRINRMSASGRLYSALQSLQDHYERLEDGPEKRQVHTIGSQTGPYTEPSAPPAATRWAAD